MAREWCTLFHNVILQGDIVDTLLWLLNHFKWYTFTGIYNYLTASEEPTIVECVVDIWHKEV